MIEIKYYGDEKYIIVKFLEYLSHSILLDPKLIKKY